MKELMFAYMTSPKEAFNLYDNSRTGKLTYSDFSKLVIKLYTCANEIVPTYPIIKDLFDVIDIRKDGIIDLNEWSQTFKAVQEGDMKATLKPTPHDLIQFEDSKQYIVAVAQIGRSRKLLLDEMERAYGKISGW